ncbi:MAG: HAD family phosphatase [Clostridia bacterium]|nr:HAD family phosphatase [Clostridia bacterium]
MPEIRLIALDLDNTLLNSEKQLSEENRRTLFRAAEEGIVVVPATGRFFDGIPDCVRSLPFLRYAITINGACVTDLGRKRMVSKAEIPVSRAIAIMEYLDRIPVIYDCYMDNWGWMTAALQDQAELFAPSPHYVKMLKELRTPVPELKKHLRKVGHDVQKIQMFFRDLSLRGETESYLKEHFPDISITSAVVNNLEINDRYATKGNALLALASYLGIDPAETMAFGDDLNDVSMLKAAGIGVAMGNASDPVKAVADKVTASCDEDGVSTAIQAVVWRENLP